MTLPLLCLVGYAAWAIALVLLIGATRATQVLLGTKRATEFPSGQPHGSERYWRLNRAHLNTLESLPIIGALVLTGTVAHVSTAAFNLLPLIAFGGRVLQTGAHIASGRARAVNVRFTGFVVQVGCYIGLVIEILRVPR